MNFFVDLLYHWDKSSLTFIPFHQGYRNLWGTFSQLTWGHIYMNRLVSTLSTAPRCQNFEKNLKKSFLVNIAFNGVDSCILL